MLPCLGSLSAVSATHSVPSPLYFWDSNNNGTPDTTALFATASGTWTTLQMTQLDAAAAQWRGNTSFDIQDNGVPSNHNVYVDGRTGPCLGSWPVGTFAVTCRNVQPRFDYYRIVDDDTYFNTTAPNHPTWNFSSAQILNAADLRGFLTHELGHWVRLVDLSQCGNPIATMCGFFTNPQSFDARTLSADDVAAANTVY